MRRRGLILALAAVASALASAADAEELAQYNPRELREAAKWFTAAPAEPGPEPGAEPGLTEPLTSMALDARPPFYKVRAA